MNNMKKYLSLLVCFFLLFFISCSNETPQLNHENCQEFCEECEECIECEKCEICEECEKCEICEECEKCEVCEECPICPELPTEDKKEPVVLGIDRIDEYLDWFEGKRVGLITNPTGINSNYESSIDVLFEKVNLVSLFAPEHGIRGSADAGATVGNEVDPVTKLPVYSLYGSTQKPTKAMMDTIDVMCIDIQDVGARFYTYIYTMAYAMEACRDYGKRFIVFDRPNPVSGDIVEGNILDMNYSSFIGKYPLVQRHGMTIGEIARYFAMVQGLNCELKIVKMKNWNRSYYFEDCNLPWVLPSPNMPTVDTAVVYTGTCIFEGTNLSEGRGTTRPFELIGAPFIDSVKWAKELNALGLDGVVFRPASFTPSTSKFSGQTCYGVQVHVTDRKIFDAVKTGWAMLDVVRDLYPNKITYTSTINLITGCSYFRSDKYTLEEYFNIIEEDTKEFLDIRKNCLLY